MKESEMNVKLLRHTEEAELVAAFAAKICYNKVGIDDLEKDMAGEKAKALLKKIMEAGHYSVIEHANFTFAVEGVSRALTHQLVRHRLASYSQQSQRYVDAESFSYVIPPKIKNDAKARKKFEEFMGKSMEAYKELQEVSPKEDARYILPNATDTKIVVTMNARTLYNFFEKRCCTRAQWEIQGLAEKMLKLCKEAAPLLFENAGSTCVSKGYCPEERPCGRYKEVGAILLRKG